MQRRSQWGHVIHISSMAAHRVPSPSDAFYAATKHGLRALAEGLRQEVGFAWHARLHRIFWAFHPRSGWPYCKHIVNNAKTTLCAGLRIVPFVLVGQYRNMLCQDCLNSCACALVVLPQRVPAVRQALLMMLCSPFI